MCSSLLFTDLFDAVNLQGSRFGGLFQLHCVPPMERGTEVWLLPIRKASATTIASENEVSCAAALLGS